MRKDLKTNLSCLITKNGGAGRLDLQENKLINIQKYVYCRKLERCIDNLAETLEKRLEATQVRAMAMIMISMFYVFQEIMKLQRKISHTEKYIR